MYCWGIVTALEVSPDEDSVLKDIFTHLYNVYEEAGKDTVVYSDPPVSR